MGLNKNQKFQKGKTKMGSGEIVSSMMEMQDTLEEKLGAKHVKMGMWKCSGTVSKKMCARYYDLIRRVDRKARKARITQEMINKRDEQRKWKSVQLLRKKEELQKTED